jgi:hypothetical protein
MSARAAFSGEKPRAINSTSVPAKKMPNSAITLRTTARPFKTRLASRHASFHFCDQVISEDLYKRHRKSALCKKISQDVRMRKANWKGVIEKSGTEVMSENQFANESQDTRKENGDRDDPGRTASRLTVSNRSKLHVRSFGCVHRFGK